MTSDAPRHAEPGSWADFIAAHDPGDGRPVRIRPVARVVARLVDYALLTSLIGFGLEMFAGAWNPIRLWGPVVAGLWIPLAWVPVEALFLASAATTPGKFLLGIRVVDPRGGPPLFVPALKRSTRAWAEGLALGVPVIAALAALRAALVLQRERRAPWDAAAGTHLVHRPPRGGRAVASGLGVVAAFGLAALVVVGADAGQQAEQNVEKVVAGIRSWTDLEGTTLDVQRSLAGELSTGGEHRIAVTLAPGETWAAAAACDDDCLDIDLFLVDESGDTLASDERVFEEASVFFEAHAPMPAELVVQMFECAWEPCAYAVRLLRLDPGMASGSGTCFAVAPGVLVTARHVVVGRDSVFVRFGAGDDRIARVLYEDPDADVAVLSIEDTDHGVLSIAPADALFAGASVFTYGFPAADVLGAEGKVTDGVVSALLGPAGEDDLLQTSTPIQPGNSGGPLLNERGEVFGLMIATARSDAFYSAVGELPQNVNWAVHAQVLARVLAESGVELPGPVRPAPDRRRAVERAIAATCYLETR